MSLPQLSLRHPGTQSRQDRRTLLGLAYADAIRSPEACASVVVKLTMPEV
jgi:hypothetical protein